MPQEAREAIHRAGLSLRSPIADLTATKILDRFRYLVRKLHAAGRVAVLHSVHDPRHAFAVRLYESMHDVYEVNQALGHANVAVTETYLRSLGMVEGV